MGTVQIYKANKIKVQVENFDVYMNNKDKFKSNFPNLKIKNVEEKFTTG